MVVGKRILGLPQQDEGAPAKDIAIHQERIGAARRRPMLSPKALATVRKLAVPALQVSIDQRQLVIGGR